MTSKVRVSHILLHNWNFPIVVSVETLIAILFTNIFVPKHRIIFDKRLHQLATFLVITNNNFNTSRPDIILRSAKCAVLANNYLRNPIEQYRPTAHISGRQRRIQRRSTIVGCFQSSGIFQAIQLSL